MPLDPEKLIPVATCASIAEATVLKSAIEESGIDAVVDGDCLNSAYGNIGPSLSDAKLLVRQEDAEEVEGGFEVCWSCGLARDEIEAPFPATADVIETIDSPDVDTDQLGRATENPYESPRAMGAAEDEEQESDPEAEKAESKMTLMLLLSAACLWIPFIPGVGALYVLHSANRKRLPIAGRAASFFWVAVFLLVATHLFWAWILWGPKNGT